MPGQDAPTKRNLILREIGAWFVGGTIITAGIAYGYHLRPDFLGVLIGLMASFVFTAACVAIAAIGRIE